MKRDYLNRTFLSLMAIRIGDWLSSVGDSIACWGMSLCSQEFVEDEDEDEDQERDWTTQNPGNYHDIN